MDTVLRLNWHKDLNIGVTMKAELMKISLPGSSFTVGSW